MTTATVTHSPIRGGDASPKLHPYQEQAVDYVRQRNRAGLFLQMGLG